ncbi:MAG: M4 family metallopeptidase [Actinomycetota bacterium]|nr:M4 family metallopeptidase [Actinomycetota bacterium]
MTSCHFIPPYLLRHLSAAQEDADLARRGSSTLAIDEQLRARRLTPPPQVDADSAAALRPSGEDAWTIHTADNDSTLPGSPVRSADEPASGDVAVDEAYDGVEASLSLFADIFARTSYDGKGAPVIATVHYEKDYANAFWDGRQLVFGDGDGKVFERFTKPVDVLAHEFTHAVTQHTAGFAYEGQSGALNESMSDVFAACVKQRLLAQSAADADWLIGEGIFLASVNGRALRSMSEPGTGYDDPVLGRDPQIGHMSDYVETSDDNGGVHLNSGIPNRAFFLAAVAIGGSSWEGTGQIWYAALTSGVGSDTDFVEFAAATVAAADGSTRPAVVEAWAQVGIEVPAVSGGPSHSSAELSGPSSEPADSSVSSGLGGSPASLVAVRRSGGFAGTITAGMVDLDTDPRSPEVQQLLARVDFASVAVSPPQPDRFVYAFDVPGEGEVILGEQALTPELSRLASLVLDEE